MNKANTSKNNERLFNRDKNLEIACINLELRENKYPLYIGADLLPFLNDLIPFLHSQVFIVTNSVVAPLYLEIVKKNFLNKQCDVLVLPDGEQYKNYHSLNLIFDNLLMNKHLKTTTLIALGGGVIGDLTGFAAACYMRGVQYIQLPTTLLAQIDSSIGGKTAINHPLGKNMIGTFYQPRAVMIDLNILKTLPDREFKAGLAEMIKYGLIRDEHFFCWLEDNIQQVLQRDFAILQNAILFCCKAKAAIVAEDEYDNGLRNLLNFGHTFAHAIEAALGYGHWLHGEAVALGIILAAELSVRMGWLEQKCYLRIKKLITEIGLPDKLPQELTSEALIQYMMLDKKNTEQHLRFILLTKIGQAKISDEVALAILQQTLKANVK